MTRQPKVKQRILEIWGQEPSTMDELAQCVIAVIEQYTFYRHYGKKLEPVSTPKVIGFAWDLYHGTVSNSHSAPQNGVTNFSRNASKPCGYPGWSGRVWIRYQKEPTSFGSDPFSDTLTYTGTGGRGSYAGLWGDIQSARYRNNRTLPYPEPQVYSWDYRIYDSDWPLVTANLEKQALLSTIRESTLVNFSPHYFRWTDPQTWDADLEYLHKIKSMSHKYTNEHA